jgi:hypothetical protein
MSLPAEVISGAIRHLNADHRADLLSVARHQGYLWASAAEVAALDASGIALALSGEGRSETVYLPFARPATDRASLREALVALVMQAAGAPTQLAANDPETVVAALRSRRTIGLPSFSAQAPDHARVLEAIESARWAPNHHRTEPWRFYLLDAGRIARLGELWTEVQLRRGVPPERATDRGRQWAQAPGVVILTCESAPDTDDVTRKEDYAACCCAAQNLMLHLWAHGIGSKWSTAAVWTHEGFWPLLGHAQPPAGAEVVGIFFYGIPARVPEGRRVKWLSEITTNFREGVVMD